MSGRLKAGLVLIMILAAANLWRYGAFKTVEGPSALPDLPFSLAEPRMPGEHADLFSFQLARATARGPRSAPQLSATSAPATAVPAPGLDLPAWSALGLVKRQGRTLVLLQHSGGSTETVQAGQSLGDGWNVESIAEDGVRLRRSDGKRALLPLRGAP